ncbi:dynamin family protein [Bacillus changyiensis]|uniref:dynamin family protein n=1 Tax=Bacillus changyiensis TaxID=3004103 RepID=UPI0022E96364|nr:dynamin family protein [Bacillus changyiensis]MDA1475410.1 dynamin family protein [Bacillus changyiensis]
MYVNREDSLKTKAGVIYKQLKKNGDEKRAAQLAAIIRKWVQNEVYIALTGHYSAGKSSLLNTLLQEDVLPTSPIPTSANLVLIRQGEPKTVIHTQDGKMGFISGSFDKQTVQAYCKDGSQIEMIEIEGAFHRIAPHSVLIDTPGIDSTDDAHLLSTSSILYQADALFYVMHYNHVHSEENINFLRSIKGKIPNIYCIINQVDRHDESETDFQVYKKQVVDMLLKEGITADQLFFTSATDINHQLNDLKQLQEILTHLQTQAEQQLLTNTEQKVSDILNEHIEMLIHNTDDELLEKMAALTKKLAALEVQLKDKEAIKKTVESHINKEIKSIIDNANLTPFEMREYAKAFLEANEKSFKKGFLFSKTKTREEKQKRQDTLLQDVQKRVQAEIDWHIIETFKTFAQQYEMKNGDFLTNLLNFSTKMTEDDLVKPLKKGATFSPEYVLNYTKELADNIRRTVKINAQVFIERFYQLVNEKEGQKTTILKKEYEHEKGKLIVLKEQLQLHEKAAHLKKIWKADVSGETVAADWFILKKDSLQDPLEIKRTDSTAFYQEPIHTEKGSIEIKSMSEYISLFIEFTQQLQDIPILKKQREEFLEKIERFQSRKFTLALFGAFSSGKSSFVNALCGKKVLPSSPTPTTATINKVTKPSATKRDGTADVVFKTETELMTELNQLLDGKMVKAKGRTFSEQLQHLLRKGRLDREQHLLTEHMLEAYSRFQDDIINQNTLTIPVDQLQQYAVDEKTACAVREVIVYLQTPMTNKGITIVDTPGAGSMNKRHSEVAFQYMNEADALLYLTYYQHAFSKADRSFLHKLGLIKDAFSMDKMFFVLNATDLAKSSDELATVEEYVKGELLKQGIQHPQIYHVSSKQELTGTTVPYNDFSRLRHDLSCFIEKGLTKAALDQLIYEGKKLCETIFHLHRSLHRSVQEADEEKKQIEKAYEAARSAILAAKLDDFVFLMTEKDIKEQCYYIQQRLFFYAHDLFKAEIHPGLQNGHWQANLQHTVKNCLKEYEFEFIQELKALDIRVANMMIKYADEQWISVTEQQNDNRYFSFHLTIESQDKEDEEQAEVSIGIETFADELKKYRTGKAFFQQNGKAVLIDALTARLKKMTDDWFKSERQVLLDRCKQRAENLQQMVTQTAMAQIAKQKESYFLEPLNSDEGEKIEKAYIAAKEYQEQLIKV